MEPRAVLLGAPNARDEPFILRGEPGQALVQQRQLVPREPGLESVACDPERLAARGELVVARAILDDRHQGGRLLFGFEHGIVRPVQVVEMMDEGTWLLEASLSGEFDTST